MGKIIKRKIKARYIAILLVAIVAIGAYYVYYAKGDHTSETQFGSWNQQIMLEYPDGSVNPLGVFNPIFAVFHAGQEITAIHYVLSAKATGTGYTALTINLASYDVRFYLNGATYQHTYDLPFTETAISTPIDGEWHQLVDKRIDINTITGTPAPDGSYPLVITPMGTITYSVDSGTPVTCTIPTAITETLDIINAQQYTLAVTVFPAGSGTVTLNPTGPTYPSGTAVTLTAVNSVSGYIFDKWEGDLTGRTNPTTITMNGNKAVTARFKSGTSQYEDLSTYTHGGETSPVYLTLPATTSVQATLMPRSATCYLQKARAIGTSNFNLDFKVYASYMEQGIPAAESDTSGGSLCLLLAKNITTTNLLIYGTANDGVALTYRGYATNRSGVITNYNLIQLRVRHPGGLYDFTEHNCPLGVIYDVTVSRTGGTVSLTIKSGGTTIHTGTLACTSTINYFVPMCGNAGAGGAPTRKATGLFSDFKFT